MSNSANTTRVDLKAAPKPRPAWDFEATRVIVLPNTLQQVAPTRRIALPATLPAPVAVKARPPMPPAAALKRTSYYAKKRGLSECTGNTHTRVDAVPPHQVLVHAYPQTFIAPVEGTDPEIDLAAHELGNRSRLPWALLKRCVTVGIVTTLLLGVGFYLGFAATSAGESGGGVLQALLY